MHKPVFTFENRRMRIESYGKALAYDPSKPTLEEERVRVGELALQSGAENTLWLRLSTKQYCEGRFSAVNRSWLPRSNTDFCTLFDAKRYNGIYFGRPGDSVGFVTRDCPMVILGKKEKSPVLRSSILAIHCSRDALHGVDIGRPGASIIPESVSMCMTEWGDLSDVYGVITLGIAPEHFPNDRYPNITSSLIERWGDTVVPDTKRCTIDLVALIKAQLASVGINPSNIEHDGLDTYSDERLASTRRGHEGFHNLVIVTSK